ncbi:MAG: hypothetical protein PHV17_09770, partial [Candidatus Omnitrophica bacterium]|nr:hypothetical protein [Candidatus Omnitrophota bacterium]
VTTTGIVLFDSIADFIQEFLSSHNYNAEYELGFTFSFPAEQTDIDKGILTEWCKGFTATGVEGNDIIHLLRQALTRRGVTNVSVVSLDNDTTGTQVARAYTNSSTSLAVILGTGFNICYREVVRNIRKAISNYQADHMIINMEAGNFDKGLKRTVYDKHLDALTTNAGAHWAEKMISGKYLGEIVRLILVDFIERGLLFSGKLPKVLQIPESFETRFMDVVESDKSSNLWGVRCQLKRLGIDHVTSKEAKIVREIVKMVATRSAKLSATMIVGVIIFRDPKITRHHTAAIDGSVYEKYPRYKQRMRTAFRQILGEKVKYIHTHLTHDGSGIGAGVIAAVASGNNKITSNQSLDNGGHDIEHAIFEVEQAVDRGDMEEANRLLVKAKRTYPGQIFMEVVLCPYDPFFVVARKYGDGLVNLSEAEQMLKATGFELEPLYSAVQMFQAYTEALQRRHDEANDFNIDWLLGEIEYFESKYERAREEFVEGLTYPREPEIINLAIIEKQLSDYLETLDVDMATHIRLSTAAHELWKNIIHSYDHDIVRGADHEFFALLGFYIIPDNRGIGQTIVVINHDNGFGIHPQRIYDTAVHCVDKGKSGIERLHGRGIRLMLTFMALIDPKFRYTVEAKGRRHVYRSEVEDDADGPVLKSVNLESHGDLQFKQGLATRITFMIPFEFIPPATVKSKLTHLLKTVLKYIGFMFYLVLGGWIIRPCAEEIGRFIAAQTGLDKDKKSLDNGGSVNSLDQGFFILPGTKALTRYDIDFTAENYPARFSGKPDYSDDARSKEQNLVVFLDRASRRFGVEYVLVNDVKNGSVAQWNQKQHRIEILKYLRDRAPPADEDSYAAGAFQALVDDIVRHERGHAQGANEDTARSGSVQYFHQLTSEERVLELLLLTHYSVDFGVVIDPGYMRSLLTFEDVFLQNEFTETVARLFKAVSKEERDRNYSLHNLTDADFDLWPLKQTLVAFDIFENRVKSLIDQSYLTAAERDKLKDILQWLLFAAFADFVRGRRANPVHHSVQTLENMITIALGAYRTSDNRYDAVKDAAALALLHDIGAAESMADKVISNDVTIVIKEGLPSSYQDSSDVADLIRVREEMMLPRAPVVAALEKAFTYRQEHMLKGAPMVRSLLAQAAEVFNVTFAVDHIVAVVAVHDDSSVVKYYQVYGEYIENPAVTELADLLFDSGQTLAILLRDADRMWMLSPEGLVKDLMGDYSKIGGMFKVRDKVLSNTDNFRKERKLYAELGVEGTFRFGTLFRTD